MTKEELKKAVTEEMIEYSKDHLVFHEEEVVKIALTYHLTAEDEE